MGLKDLLRKCMAGYKFSSDTYVNYLRKIGVQVGENVNILLFPARGRRRRYAGKILEMKRMNNYGESL